MNIELERIYADMNQRNAPSVCSPRANPTLEGRCCAVYGLEDWILQASWHRFWKAVEFCLPVDSYVKYSATPLVNEGLLHQTLLLYLGFDTPNSKDPTIVARTSEIVRSIVEKYSKAIWIQYRGIVWTPTGLALAGYPQDTHDYDYIMEMRSRIEETLKKEGLPFEASYTYNTLHATILRWKSIPDETCLEILEKEVKRWEECIFGEMRINTWFIGKGSWKMNVEEREDLYKVPIYRFVCHRGNLFGKQIPSENKPNILQIRDVQHLDVECDVWWQNGKLWLGHDIPEYETTLEWLSQSPRRLIHAKDGLTFEYLLGESGKRALDLHIFYHTDEDYVLTSKGIVIVYPGKPLLKGSLCMMPESAKKPYALQDREKIFMLCSDKKESINTCFA
jgi:hypothetical protein